MHQEQGQRGEDPGQVGVAERPPLERKADAGHGEVGNPGETGVAAGQLPELAGDREHDQLEGQGGEGQVMAAQAQHGQADHHSHRRRQHRRQQQRGQRWDPPPGQDPRAVGAYRVEGALAQGDLAGEAVKQVEARDHDDRETDEDVDGQLRVVEQERQQQRTYSRRQPKPEAEPHSAPSGRRPAW